MISPDDIAQHGRAIAAAAQDEVSWRCAIARLYYAAFHRCIGIVDRLCDEPPENGSPTGLHKRLYHRMEQCCREPRLRRQMRMIARTGRNFHTLRVTADYHLGRQVNSNDVDRAMRYLTEIETDIGAVLAVLDAP